MLHYFQAMRTRNSIKKPWSRNTTPKKTSTPRKPRMKLGLVFQESVDNKNYKGNSATAKSPDFKEEQPSTSKSGSYRKTFISRKKRKEAGQEEPLGVEDSGEEDLISEKPFDGTNESSRSNSPVKNSETSKLISPTKNEEASELNSPGKNKRTSRSKSPVKNKENSASNSPSKNTEASGLNSPGNNKRTSNSKSPVKNKETSVSNSRSENTEVSRSNTPVKNKRTSRLNTPDKNKRTSRLNTPDKIISTWNTPNKKTHTSTSVSAGTISESEGEETMKEDDSMTHLAEVNETSHVSKVSNENDTNELISGQTSETMSYTVNGPQQNIQKEPSSEVLSPSRRSQNGEPFSDSSSKKTRGNSSGKDNSTLKRDSVKPEKKIKFNRNPDFKIKYNEEKSEDFYECPLCYKEFETRKQVKRHYRIHVEEKTYVCNKCDIKFLARWDLKLHKETFIHCQKKLYECSVCRKGFTTRYLCGQHENTHKGLRFRCKGCLRSYVYKRDLVRHVKIHHLDLDPSEDTKYETLSDDEGPKFNYINNSPWKDLIQGDVPNPDGVKNVHQQIIPAQVVEVRFDEDSEKETDQLETRQDSRNSHDLGINVKSPENAPSQSLVNRRRYADLETYNSGLLPQDSNKLQDSTSDNNASEPGSAKKRKKKKSNEQSLIVSPIETRDPLEVKSLNDNVTEVTVGVGAQDPPGDQQERGEFELTTTNQDSQNEGELRIYAKSPENTPDTTPIKRNRRYKDSETYNSRPLPEDPNKLQNSTNDNNTSEPGSAKKRKKEKKKKKSNELSLSLTEELDPLEIPTTSDNLTEETDPLSVTAQVTGTDQHECPVCDRIVTSIRKLQKHLKKKHSIDSV